MVRISGSSGTVRSRRQESAASDVARSPTRRGWRYSLILMHYAPACSCKLGRPWPAFWIRIPRTDMEPREGGMISEGDESAGLSKVGSWEPLSLHVCGIFCKMLACTFTRCIAIQPPRVLISTTCSKRLGWPALPRWTGCLGPRPRAVPGRVRPSWQSGSTATTTRPCPAHVRRG